MNERVKELAEQANLKLDDLPDEVFIPLEEFAELIVRECIEEFRGEVQHWYDWEVDDEMLEQVKKHFGVE